MSCTHDVRRLARKRSRIQLVKYAVGPWRSAVATRASTATAQLPDRLEAGQRRSARSRYPTSRPKTGARSVPGCASRSCADRGMRGRPHARVACSTLSLSLPLSQQTAVGEALYGPPPVHTERAQAVGR